MGIWQTIFGGAKGMSPRAATQNLGGGVVVNVKNSHDLDRYLRGELGGDPALPDAAMTVAAVFGCVRLISGAVANMPLYVKRRVDGRTLQDATDSPIWGILQRRPNSWMTPSLFRRMQTAHVLLRGNAYALIVRVANNIEALVPLHPDKVKVMQNTENHLLYTYQHSGGQQIVLAQDDVFHLVGMTSDGITGESVISYARNTIELARSTESHGNQVFQNGAHVGSVFMHPNQLSDEAISHLKASLEEYRGSDNAGKTLILEEGMDFKPLGMTAEDAQYIETRKFTRSEIAMFFGVPPHMIGDTEKSTSWGTGIEQQGLGFRAYTLQDYLTMWEETCNRDLLTDPALSARFDTKALVRGDLAARYSAYSIGRQWGWLSANDVRAEEGLNPIDGGDDYLEPLNMVPAGSERDDTEKPAQD